MLPGEPSNTVKEWAEKRFDTGLEASCPGDHVPDLWFLEALKKSPSKEFKTTNRKAFTLIEDC
jgi:hypothetical protein